MEGKKSNSSFIENIKYTEQIIIYRENPKESTKNTIMHISELNIFAKYKSTYKNQVLEYIKNIFQYLIPIYKNQQLKIKIKYLP